MAAAALFDVDGAMRDTDGPLTLAWPKAPTQVGHTPAIAVLSGRA